MTKSSTGNPKTPKNSDLEKNRTTQIIENSFHRKSGGVGVREQKRKELQKKMISEIRKTCVKCPLKARCESWCRKTVAVFQKYNYGEVEEDE